jgi:hypothetical protein
VSPTPKPGGASIASTTPTILEVAAADDKGISKVEFYVGTRLVCTATAAPYRCSYLPQGVDLGRNTLTAIAYDSAGQTATALNQAIVPRFTARSLSARGPEEGLHVQVGGDVPDPGASAPEDGRGSRGFPRQPDGEPPPGEVRAGARGLADATNQQCDSGRPLGRPASLRA